jgi:hypothetical protein
MFVYHKPTTSLGKKQDNHELDDRPPISSTEKLTPTHAGMVLSLHLFPSHIDQIYPVSG